VRFSSSSAGGTSRRREYKSTGADRATTGYLTSACSAQAASAEHGAGRNWPNTSAARPTSSTPSVHAAASSRSWKASPHRRLRLQSHMRQARQRRTAAQARRGRDRRKPKYRAAEGPVVLRRPDATRKFVPHVIEQADGPATGDAGVYCGRLQRGQGRTDEKRQEDGADGLRPAPAHGASRPRSCRW